MVMIPMFEDENVAILELPRPKPELRLLEGGLADELPFLAASQNRTVRVVAGQLGERRASVTTPTAPLRSVSASVYRRRRIVLGSMVAAVLGAGLFAVVGVLAPAPLPPGAATAVPGIALKGYYTVQSNDTFDAVVAAVAGRSSLSEVSTALVNQLGSKVVVPGEKIAIP